MENMNKQNFDKHYNDSLEWTQKEIAQGDDLYYVCGFAPKYSIPTDTTPGHLGLAKRIHQGWPKEDVFIDFYMNERAVMLTNPCPGEPSPKSSPSRSSNSSSESSSSILFMPIFGF